LGRQTGALKREPKSLGRKLDVDYIEYFSLYYKVRSGNTF